MCLERSDRVNIEKMNLERSEGGDGTSADFRVTLKKLEFLLNDTKANTVF